MPRHPNPSQPRLAGQAPGLIVRNPVLHEADPRDLQAAADELRDRTMTLERDELFPAPKRLLVLLGVAALVAVGTIVFRSELKGLLGLL